MLVKHEAEVSIVGLTHSEKNSQQRCLRKGRSTDQFEFVCKVASGKIEAFIANNSKLFFHLG